METSLRLKSDDRQMMLCAKENFVTEGNIALQVRGRLNVATGQPSGTLQLRKKFFPDMLTSIDIGAKMDLGSKAVSYNLQAKKTIELSGDGLTCVDLKAGYQYKTTAWGPDAGSQGTPELRARVEVSQKVFNFTEDQDLKVKLGYDIVERRPYAQVRENNWTFNAELRNNNREFAWNVAYDL